MIHDVAYWRKMFADGPMIYDVVYWRKMFADPLTPKPEGFIAAILYGDEYWALVKNERDRFPNSSSLERYG